MEHILFEPSKSLFKILTMLCSVISQYICLVLWFGVADTTCDDLLKRMWYHAQHLVKNENSEWLSVLRAITWNVSHVNINTWKINLINFDTSHKIWHNLLLALSKTEIYFEYTIPGVKSDLTNMSKMVFFQTDMSNSTTPEKANSRG